MSDYEALDQAILDCILFLSETSDGAKTHQLLESTEIAKAAADVARGRPLFRVLDARLTALRKRENIVYCGHKIGWKVCKKDAP